MNIKNERPKNSVINFIYLFFVSIFVLGFFFANTQFFGRSRDYENYMQIFSGYDNNLGLELFYRLLLNISPSYLFVIVVILSASLLIKSIFIAKYSFDKVSLLFFLVYYSLIAVWVLDYTQFRNGLCISILMFATYFLYNKKIKNYYITVLLAIMTHWSALPFLFLYPFVYSRKIRLAGYFVSVVTLIISISGQGDGLIFYIRSFGLGQKIGNDAGVNLINSLSIATFTWFLITYKDIPRESKAFFRLFFTFGLIQYIVFGLFSLPVMSFRIIEMYFFLMLSIGIFIKQTRHDVIIVPIKILILCYLAYYYHVVFGVINV